MSAKESSIVLYITLFFLFIILMIILFLIFRIFKNSNQERKRVLNKKNKNIDYEEIERENSNFRESLLNALSRMSDHKIGALIAVENNDDLTFFEQSGYEVNGTFSPEFVLSIFSNKKSALHDGAVIIRDRRIVSISSYLPMTKNIIDVKYGARHRAAIGLSEKTDAIVFVVSETNGNISYAINGKLNTMPSNKKDRVVEMDIILR